MDGHEGKCKKCRLSDLKKLRAIGRFKERELLKAKKYSRIYPERIIAKGKIRNMLKYGKMIKPKKCEVCLKSKKLLAHHEDYNKPLDVRWVCYSCHKLIHQGEISVIRHGRKGEVAEL